MKIMTNWFPTNKQILKTFFFNTIGWTLLAILYGVLSNTESILLGLGTGTAFTLIYIVQLWNTENIRRKLMKKYQNSEIYQTLHLKTLNIFTISGIINGFNFRLTPIVDSMSTIKFKLELDLKDKPHLNNQLNLNRTLDKFKFSVNESTVEIPNWAPKVWSYNKLEKIIERLTELLNKLG
ncbi:MAG: hypothetical protein OCD76_06820 [Reichenbachiella sp.]